MLDEKLQKIKEQLKVYPEVTLTYFQPDMRKDGGEYVTVTGKVKKIDEYAKAMFIEDGTRILIEDIIEIVLN